MATDGFIAASLLKSLQNADQLAENVFNSPRSNSSNYSEYRDKYRNLLVKWNDLVDEDKKKFSLLCQQLRQILVLLTYINAGRIVNSFKPLELSEITNLSDNDPYFKKIIEHSIQVGQESGFNCTSEAEYYWGYVNKYSFEYFGTAIHEGYDPYRLYDQIDAKTFANGDFGKVSGTLRFYNITQSHQYLATLNREAQAEIFDLSQENERLKAENAKLRGQLANLLHL